MVILSIPEPYWLNKTVLGHSLLLDITIDVSKTNLLLDFGDYRFLCNINVEIVA